jgi:hypothetical protein
MTKTLFLSKYALADGIKECEFSGEDEYGYCCVWLGGYYNSYKMGTHVHETFEGAKAAAEKMRARKIASLRKQIAKLEALDF